MFIQLEDFYSKNNDIDRPHHGVVVSNNDPKHLRRIKVSIKGFLQGANLPWIYPKTPYFLGGGQGAVEFSVPEVGSEVVVEFPFRDIYFGFYTGHWVTKKEPNEFNVWSMDDFPVVEFDENYPNSYGFRDSNGNYFRVNKIKNTMELYHKSTVDNETRIRISDDGNIDISTIGDFTLSHTGNLNLNTIGTINILVPIDGATVSFNGIGGIPLVIASVSELGNLSVAVPIGEFDVLVTKDFSLASLSVNIAAGVDVNISAGGKVSVSALGDASVNAGGKATVSAVGNATISAGGTANITAGGVANITAGDVVNIQAGGNVSIVGAATVEVIATAALLLTSVVSIAVEAPVVLLGQPHIGYAPLMLEGGHFSYGVVAAY